MRLDTIEKRAFYRAGLIPTGAVKDSRSSELGEAYLYEKGIAYCAVGFRGSAGKPAFRYRWVRPENREAHLANFFECLKTAKAVRDTRKAARVKFVHSLAEGDILSASWGYDQTNIDYFQVTRLIGKCKVEIREIASSGVDTGFMCGDCVPRPGDFKGEPKIKLVQEGNCVKIFDWGVYARKIEPTATIAGTRVFAPKHYSYYH